MNAWDKYRKPTPWKWRKIGDAISLLGTTLTATIATLQVHYGWIIACAVLTWLGSTITSFASE